MSSMVVVGGVEYQVVKTGRAQAEQALGITRWIGKYGIPIIDRLRNDKDEVVIDEGRGMDFLIQILENLTADALIDLFQALVGCSQAAAEVHFDVATLIEVALTVYNEQPSIRRLIERFFSEPSLPEVQSSDESSTTSEQPTDGQTTQF